MPGDYCRRTKRDDYREIPIDGEYCPAPKIGTAIADADIIISMNHFKGHEQAGFGGALKNLGMGCASVGGKLELHASSQPKVATENCIGCNICVKHCAHDAIHLNAERKAEIDYTKCVGLSLIHIFRITENITGFLHFPFRFSTFFLFFRPISIGK